MVCLYIKDNNTGNVREYGTSSHDCLIVGKNGSLEYYNLQNGGGTFGGEYSFCFYDGSPPRDSDWTNGVIDIGGEYFKNMCKESVEGSF